MKYRYYLCLHAAMLLSALGSEAFANTFIVNALEIPSSIKGTADYLGLPQFNQRFDPDSVKIYTFEGPHSPPSLAPFLSPLTTDGRPVHNLGVPSEPGLIFGADVIYQGGTPGFGPFSGTTVIGNRNYPYNGPVDISFAGELYDSVAIHVADGPTAEIRLDVFGASGNLLGSVLAPNNPSGGFNGFLGFSAPGALVAAIRLQGFAFDDIYYDNLTLGFIPVDDPGPGGNGEIPEPATIMLLTAGLLGLRERKKRSAN